MPVGASATSVPCSWGQSGPGSEAVPGPRRDAQAGIAKLVAKRAKPCTSTARRFWSDSGIIGVFPFNVYTSSFIGVQALAHPFAAIPAVVAR